jgi:hypothetical protein
MTLPAGCARSGFVESYEGWFMRFLRKTVYSIPLFALWADGSRLAYAQDAEPPSPAPTTPAASETPSLPAPPALQPARPEVVVHLDAEAGVELEAHDWGANAWSPVCAAPCDARLPLDLDYRLAAPSKAPSRAFWLTGTAGGQVRVVAKTPSAEAGVRGVELIAIGSAVMAVGLAVVIGGAISNALDCYGEGNAAGGGSCPPPIGVEVAGAVTALVGAGILAGGIVFKTRLAHWRYTQTIATGDVPLDGERGVAGWLRAPMWRGGPEGAVGAARVGVPIFLGTF